MKRGLWSGVFLLAVAGACSSGGGGGGGVVGSNDGGSPPTVDGSTPPPDNDAGQGTPDATVDAPPPDTTPPTFAGATGATALGQTQIAVTWAPATDNVTPQASIAYRVYIGTAAGGESFTAPVVTSPAGATGTVISALNAWTTYFIVVRAVDQAGNEDTNTVEVSAKTTDVTPPVFAGAQSVTGTGANTALVSWNAATDNGSAPSAITYNIYASETQGGETFTTPSLTTAAGVTSGTITGLTEAAPVFVIVRAVDAAGNEDTNHHEVSGLTLDTTPATFAGAQTATALGNTVTLGWNAATDIYVAPSTLVYDVYEATSAGGESFATPSFTTVAGATSYTVLGLQLSTKYYFVVRARDQYGNEDTNTAEVSATTQASKDTAPPTFAGLATASGLSDTTIDLSWAAASDPYTPAADIVYDIFTSPAAGAENFASPTYSAPAGATSFTIVGLQPLQTLYVVVRARNLSGLEDTNTVEKSATTLADTIPPTFGGLVSATAISDQAIQLSWTAATDDVSASSAITYRVYEGNASGAEGTTPVSTTLAGQTSITISALTPKTGYWFVVHAVDQAGNEDNNTIEQTATTFPDTTPPTFAGVSSLVSTSPTTLTATWTAATDDVTPQVQIIYLPYLSTTPGGEDFAVSPTPTGPGVTTYTFTGLLPNTEYYVVVRAEDQAGNVDSNVNEQSITTQADTSPPAFAGASSVTGATDTTLTLLWNAATDNVTPQSQITYLVCETTTPGGCGGTSFTTTTTVVGGTSQPFTGLVPNTAYYFVVRAVDAAGNNDGNSNEVAGQTTPDTTPPTFAGLASAVSNSPTTITLGWAAATDDVTPQNAIVYDIFQASASNGESFSGPTYTTTAGQTSYTVTGLLPGQTRWFVVRARDQAGNEAPNTVQQSATVEADTTPPTFAGITGLTATGLTSLQASWNTATSIVPPNSAIVYYVCWSTSSTACTTGFTAMATTVPGVLQYTITGLTDNTAYTVVVRAHDPYGNTDANTASLTTSTLPDTIAPTFGVGVPSVTAETATTITLTWPLATDNYSPQSALVYLVCIAKSPAVCTGSSFIASQVLTNQTTYTFTGLTNLATYNFVVRVEDQAGNIDGNNNQVSGQTVTDTTPPTFPNGALQSATALSDSTIQLSWNIATDNVSTATQITYDVYESATSGGEAACTAAPSFSVPGTAGSGSPLAQQYTVASLQPLTPYYFIVRARDAAGNRDCNTTEKTATTLKDQTAPTFGGITGLTVTNDTQLNATWTAASDDTTAQNKIVYEVCWSTTTSCTMAFVANATTAAGATAYSPAAGTLQPNTTFTFVVRAVDLSGNVSTNTQSLSAKTNQDNPPTFAGIGSVSGVTYNSATINWPVATDDYTTAANMVYDICLSTSSTGCAGTAWTAGQITASVTGATSFTFTYPTYAILTANTTFYVVVRAENQSLIFNTTNQNNQLSFVTSQDTNAPTFGGITAATATSPTSVQLSWTNATEDGVTAGQFIYDVYKQGTYTATIATSTGDGTGTINFAVTATPGTTTCYVVRAKNPSAVEDTNTTALCATTPATAPTFTTQPTVATASTTSATMSISWAASSTPATTITYTVCDSTSNTACVNFTSGGTTTSSESFSFAGLSPNTTYYFDVKATNSTGSTWSTQVSGTTKATPPTLAGSVTCNTTTSGPYPTFLWITVPTASSAIAITDYETCWSTVSGGCATFADDYDSPTSGSYWIGAAGHNAPAGNPAHGGALNSYTNYYVYVRAVDSEGQFSGTIGSAACLTSGSYLTDVAPFLQPAGAGACNGCHTGNPPGPWTAAYWAGTTPVNYCGTGTPAPYTSPGNANGSLIYQVLKYVGCDGVATDSCYTGGYTCIPPMPEDGHTGSYTATYKSGTYTGMIGSWINGGANGAN